MPYNKSLARKSFDLDIDQMIFTIRDTFLNKHVSNATKEYVLSCSIMLCFAKVEVYIEDFFDNWFNKINTTQCKCLSLPENLRALMISDSFLKDAYKKFFLDNNESKLIKTLAKNLSNNIFQLTDPNQYTPNLVSKKIYSKKKYPSPDNFSVLFKRIGIEDIFSEINKSSKSNMERVLESFNDTRTAIAHNGIPVGINNKDVINKLRSIKTLIYHTDKALSKHVHKHTSRSTWVV